jgi:GlpG protein
VVAAASLGARWSPQGQQKFLSAINPLLITQVKFSGDHVGYLPGLPEIRQGQVWRLISPIFIHFDLFHLLFNMLWLYQLGSLIEGRKGSALLAILVLVSALPSNLLQYLWPIGRLDQLFGFWHLNSNPLAGGMSGVVYALFGYVWMKSRHQPQEGFYLHPKTVFVMIAWFVLCFTGLLGPIGNTAHAVGLIAGVIFGAGPHWLRRLRRRM